MRAVASLKPFRLARSGLLVRESRECERVFWGDLDPTARRGGGHLIVGLDLSRTDASLPSGRFVATERVGRIEYALNTHGRPRDARESEDCSGCELEDPLDESREGRASFLTDP